VNLEQQFLMRFGTESPRLAFERKWATLTALATVRIALDVRYSWRPQKSMWTNSCVTFFSQRTTFCFLVIFSPPSSTVCSFPISYGSTFGHMKRFRQAFFNSCSRKKELHDEAWVVLRANGNSKFCCGCNRWKMFINTGPLDPSGDFIFPDRCMQHSAIAATPCCSDTVWHLAPPGSPPLIDLGSS
jgi:hypothetical protein